MSMTLKRLPWLSSLASQDGATGGMTAPVPVAPGEVARVVVSGVLARCLSACATQQGKFEESCTPDQEAAQRRQTPEAREGHLEEGCASATGEELCTAWHGHERQPVCGESPSRVGLVRPARKLSDVDEYSEAWREGRRLGCSPTRAQTPSVAVETVLGLHSESDELVVPF